MPNPSFSFDNSYARLPDRFFARQKPTPVERPHLVRLNAAMCETLGLDPDALNSEEGATIFAGNHVPAGAEPISMAYAGHQFGGWVPQLGDGRAILLGEIVGTDGVRRDIQLKGSGRTPFSRGGDGRAALGPILREYVVSEGMHALGVPTTRALAAVKTGERVIRGAYLPGAILTRVATSHVRVGTFEFLFGKRDYEGLRTLANYVIARHYSHAKDAENLFEALLRSVMERQAVLVAKWFSLGFIHGVLNTDNTAISGETIDYGPCAFMDAYHSETVFSSIDHMGRYAFGNQSSILQWNLAKLADCLVPIIDDDIDKARGLAQAVINDFPAVFESELTIVLRTKLGLFDAEDNDLALAFELLESMAEGKADFTNTFRALADIADPEINENNDVRKEFETSHAFDVWMKRWQARLGQEKVNVARRKASMRAVNPAVIPRNHLVAAAIRAAEEEDDFQPFNALVDQVSRPFDDRPDRSVYTRPPAPEEVVRQTFCGT